MGKKPDSPVKVLFVCLGNICRSPAAEGAFIQHLKKQNLNSMFEVDSAGTSGFHEGELAHPQTRKVAAQRGIVLSSRSRPFIASQDFAYFDYLLAMDAQNWLDMHSQAPNEQALKKLFLLRSFDSLNSTSPAPYLLPDQVQKIGPKLQVPDPWGGVENGFENVQNIVELSTLNFLNWVLAQ